MRGKGIGLLIALTVSRITPAYAGKSALRASWECLLEDHPRLCGEKPLAIFKKSLVKGSPPPMRGKVGGEGEGKDRVRITPAYAGKSLSQSSSRYASTDHPRLCGEKRFEMQCIQHHTGSPPPMRGKVCRNHGGT